MQYLPRRADRLGVRCGKYRRGALCKHIQLVIFGSKARNTIAKTVYSGIIDVLIFGGQDIRGQERCGSLS
ncbi:MAG: hypothetical protein DRP66_07470 [Planctomycetota bacterium]|nr:MAG: hypothetical protein DRP66_07470 [Planctomycetota bacterium]